MLLEAHNGTEFTLPVEPAKNSDAPYAFNEDNAKLSSKIYQLVTIVPTEFRHNPSHAIQNNMHHTVRAHGLTKSTNENPMDFTSSDGFKIRNMNTVKILPSHKRRIYTGITISIPDDVSLQVTLSPSLTKRQITTETTTFASSYKGELILDVTNESYRPIRIPANTAIARLRFT